MWVKKPWGKMFVWTESALYIGKVLRIRKGHRLSLQYHKKKAESVYVLKGRMQITIIDKGSCHDGTVGLSVLYPGQSYDIPPGTIHRFEAPFGPVELVEVAVGDDRDIVRIADDYGRVK